MHKDKTVSWAARLPIAMALLLLPAVAEAHGEQIVFLPLGQLVGLVPAAVIAWRLTRGVIARMVVILCALVAPVLLLFMSNNYLPWWLLASETSSFLTGFIASTIVAILVALFWRRLLQGDRHST
jgi:uncharacterized membrane protein